MEKWNCATCKQWDDEHNRCREKQDDAWYDDPQHMHPCEHGQPIVASAIAAVEFRMSGDYGGITIHAEHKHGEWNKDYYWEQGPVDECFQYISVADEETSKFCAECGLRLPTPEQLQAMYEQSKKEGDNRGPIAVGSSIMFECSIKDRPADGGEK